MARNIYNEPIEQEQYQERGLDLMRRGLYVLVDTMVGRILGALVAVLLAVGWFARAPICANVLPGPLGGLMLALYPVLYLPVAVAILVLFLSVLARPWYHDRIAHDLIRAGLVNKAGEPPVLTRRRREKGDLCTIWRFRSKGIPLHHWQDKQTEIQSALNVNVADVREGKDRQTVLLYTVPPATALGENLVWEDAFMDEDEAHIILGCSYTGKVTVDIDKQVHFLIGGSTGSGKSILLKVILRQALRRGADVHIADFKGGVDFSRQWHQECNIVTEEMALLTTLGEIIKELERRKQAFRRVDARNITEYRQKASEGIRRIFIGCDETAELLDKTGADKARKELLSKIESALSTIARQGRAFGIHLVLATQRPDATILVGQIKSNLDVRVCGRADATLSTIIFGDSRAHESIPKYAQGRFVLDDGTIFQGYNLMD